MDREKIIETVKEVFNTEIDSLKLTLSTLGKEVVEAVEILYNTRGKVVVTGIGKSGLVGKKIASTMSSVGTPAIFLHIGEAAHGDLGVIDGRDSVIILSYSGETEEVTTVLPTIKRLGIPLIGITGNLNSTLAKHSDVVIPVRITREACPYGLAPTSSTTVMLAIGDALAISLMKLKGFSEEDFAMLHPAGALGKTLLVRVADLMHTGDEIPRVDVGEIMEKVILEITSKRLGITGVFENGKLVGCISDGDLRRALEKYGGEMLRKRAGDLMTRNPKTITPDALASRALRKMEDHAITSLFVVPEESSEEVIGIIHIHDILKEGIRGRADKGKADKD